MQANAGLGGMLPTCTNEMSMPPSNSNEPTESSMERVTSRSPPSSRSVSQYTTTADGDIVIVQPSFDDPLEGAKTSPRFSSFASPPKQFRDDEWQARSPQADEKQQTDSEERNPSSPATGNVKHNRGHTRNLSDHFYDATTLSPSRHAHAKKDGDDEESRKHRRMFSGDVTNPPLAHRRINSIGTSAAVRRGTGRLQHQREDSGLDILSAVAGVTKDELEAAAGPRAPSLPPFSEDNEWRQGVSEGTPQARLSLGQVSTSSSYEQHQYAQVPSTVTHPQMSPPPPHRPGVGDFQAQAVGYHGPHHNAYMPGMPPYPATHYNSYPLESFYPPGYNLRTVPVPHPAYSPHYVPRAHDNSKPAHPVESHPKVFSKSKLTHEVYEDSVASAPSSSIQWTSSTKTSSEQGVQTHSTSNSTNQGVQTFVTAIAVGDGTKTILPQESLTSTSSTAGRQSPRFHSVPSQVSQKHHRTLSSCSSLGLGTFLGSSALDGSVHPLKASNSPHHRKSSSSISFLQFDVGFESADDAFLRDLQASNNAATSVQTSDTLSPTPSPAKLASSMSRRSASPDDEKPTSDQQEDDTEETKLASGGTSKRVRRKCTVAGCQNRVVQGGLCISHGAKRKTCKYPGCTKNVKKAGMCSTHGPARKRCEAEGCEKVAVQGGRCIAHGAKKKLCCVENCSKQAILSGMCKKHHDQAHSSKKASSKVTKPLGAVCQEITTPSSTTNGSTSAGKKPSHQRGFSIFQEMSVDAVQSILNEEPLDPRSNVKGHSRNDSLW